MSVWGTLRWAGQIRSPEALDLPKAGAAANGLKPAELKMAGQLISQMTAAWEPEQFKDDFTTAIHALVAAKAKAGKTATVKPFEDAPQAGSSNNVVDLTELLRQSLGGKAGKAKAPASKAAAKPPAKPPAKPSRGRKAA